MTIPINEIERCLEDYGIEAASDMCSKIQTYISLLLRWNQKISLTTVTYPLEIVRFHFGESMFAASAVPIGNGRLADVGSGAGFPGLPLKIARPQISLMLIESNFKKCAFLGEVVRALELDNVEVIPGRMESVIQGPQKMDFITERAVGQIDKVLRIGEEHLSSTGKVIMWVGENDASDAMDKNPSWKWREPARIPMSERRVLLVGSFSGN
jgi:16S rRNA (guanine527-N7)-methyltransferase